MPFPVAIVAWGVGAVVAGAVAKAVYEDHSDYSDYSDHSDYSDAAERRRREEEFREFLGWLQNVLVEKKIDVLLVAGDIFDTNSPGNSCAGMYYDFLAEVVRATGRLRIIIIGGNHDSPSFLNAPAGLLDRAFHIKVFGSAMDDPADEIVTIPGDDGEPAMIIGAVPYLRDGDLHLSSWGESPEEREEAKRTGFREHYRKIAERAEELRAGRPIPFVLTGHLVLFIIGILLSGTLFDRIEERLMQVKGNRMVLAFTVLYLVFFGISIAFVVGSTYQSFLYFAF